MSDAEQRGKVIAKPVANQRWHIRLYWEPNKIREFVVR
jgi:hypothetical protein